MYCLCGDPYCPSCGPAQGNYCCPICGRWGADGGCENPAACKAAAEEMYREEAKAEEAAAEYWKSRAEEDT